MAGDINSTRPIIKAASACVWREGKVLIARRGKAPGNGLWSLPGGKLERDESPLEAARRELLEETGIVAELGHFVGDFIIDAGHSRFVISCFSGPYVSGEARPASDSDDLVWIWPEDLQGFHLAPNTQAAIEAAQKLTSL